MTKFWDPAQPNIQIWRTLLGFVLLIGSFFTFTFFLFQIGARLIDGRPEALLGGLTPISAAIFFATFFGFHIGLLIVLPLLHRRSYLSLFGPSRRLRMRDFWIGVLVAAGIATLLYLAIYVERFFFPDLAGPEIEQVRPVSDWIVWFLPALVLIFFQTFAEEAVFRGYLLQQLRARFASVFVWAVLPSLIFGLLHFDPGTYGTLNATAYVINTTTTGILLCLITLRTGNLGAAAGLHFGNNAALTIVGIKGNLEGFSLFAVGMELQSGYTAWSILSQTGFTLILFILWWRWMNKRDKIANTAFAS